MDHFTCLVFVLFCSFYCHVWNYIYELSNTLSALLYCLHAEIVHHCITFIVAPFSKLMLIYFHGETVGFLGHWGLAQVVERLLIDVATEQRCIGVAPNPVSALKIIQPSKPDALEWCTGGREAKI